VNVLSLFDGMSCGQIALERAGIKVDNYFASEIDQHAIKVTMKNYPNTIQLGDVTNSHEWDLPKIDLLIGGSPCQGFSFAGKGLNFDDPRSKLFFEYVHVLGKIKPKYFLLENVKMKKEYEKVISDFLGVEPIEINSSLVSAQNRVRLYWTNIPGIEQPKDKRILLGDILEKHLPSCGLGGRIVGRRLNELGKREDYNFEIPISQYLELRKDNKANCLTTVYKDSVVPYFKTDLRLKIKFNQSKASCLTGGAHSGGHHSDMDILVIEPDVVRRYSPIECERLQTLPDNYTEGVSNSQRYKMLGNGWTVDVIAHILKGIAETEILSFGVLQNYLNNEQNEEVIVENEEFPKSS
jgi:DNA (cytosine-5)-methyltransferase 3A